MKVWPRALGAAMLLFGAACARTPQEPLAPGVVAAFDGVEISAGEVEEFILSFPPEQRQPTEGQSLQAWRRERLEDLIVARQLEREGLEEGLLDEGDGAALWQQRREALLVSKIEEQLLAPQLVVTEDELRTFYDENPSEFGHDGRIRVRHIYKRVARDAPAEEKAAVRQELSDLRQQLLDGGNFEDTARQHSDSETAALGGLIGRLDHGVLEPALDTLLWNLEPGELSDLVDTPIGFHVFKLDSKIEPFRTSFEEARSRLVRRLSKEARGKAEEGLRSRLIEASGAEYHSERLASADPDAVLFTLSGETLTLEDFLADLRREGFAVAREVPLDERLGQRVLRRLLLWEAERQELSQAPELVEELEQIRTRIALEAALSKRTRDFLAALPEARLREAYEADSERFQAPRLFHLRILTRDFPEDAKLWYGVYEELVALAERIENGEMTFEEAARRHSTDFSRFEGGDVGSIRLDALSEWAGPSAGKAVRELGPGEVSAPLLIERYDLDQLNYVRTGFMLVRLEELIEPVQQDFEAAREGVIAGLVSSRAVNPDREIGDEIIRQLEVRFAETVE